MSLAIHKQNILVLGGGDGLAAREILKYDDVQSVTVVDLDKEMTDLAKENKYFTKLNQNSFQNKKVTIYNEDAFKFLENARNFYDVIIVDLPDPNNSSLARLYSTEFYKILKKKLAKNGIMVTQATSPFFSPEAFWCIQKSLQKADFKNIYPYHTYVPSFGDWGFVMASNTRYDLNTININVETKYLDNELAKVSFKIEKDVIKTDIEPSTLDRPKILDYYLNGWRYWN